MAVVSWIIEVCWLLKSSRALCWASPVGSGRNATRIPAFAAERRRLQHGARSASAAIDRYRLPARRSAADPPAAVVAVDGGRRR